MIDLQGKFLNIKSIIDLHFSLEEDDTIDNYEFYFEQENGKKLLKSNKKIFQENRKSSKVKKWLILATRLLLFLSLLFAFSQPYFSNKNTTKNLTNFIYLDNSLSTIAEGEKGVLLKNAIQEIIENTSAEETFSLLTNTEFFENLFKYIFYINKTGDFSHVSGRHPQVFAKKL